MQEELRRARFKQENCKDDIANDEQWKPAGQTRTGDPENRNNGSTYQVQPPSPVKSFEYAYSNNYKHDAAEHA